MANINNNAENRVASSANNNNEVNYRENLTVENLKKYAMLEGADYLEAMIEADYDRDEALEFMETDVDYSMTEHILNNWGDIFGDDAYEWMDEVGVRDSDVHSWIMAGARGESYTAPTTPSKKTNSESKKNNSVDFSGPHASELKRVKITKAVAHGDFCGECYSVYFRIAGFEDKPNIYWTISRPVYAYNSDMAKREIMITLDKTIEYLPTTSDSAAIDLFLEKFDEAQKDVHRYYSDYRKADYGDDRIKAIACAMAR